MILGRQPSGLEKASWLGHVQRLRDLLDEECLEIRSRLSDEPENEIPVPARRESQPEAVAKDSDADGVSGAFTELQDDWKGREANEVVALIRSALALASLYQQSALGKLSVADEQDPEGLKATVLAARKALKDREWSLVEAKHKAQQLEDERLRQDCHIRALQTALDKAVSSRTEAEKRHLVAYSAADAEAAEQRGELRRRLSEAEVARDQAVAQLAAAEQRLEEVRKAAQRQEEDFTMQLAQRDCELEELRLKLSEISAAPAAPAQALPAAAAPSLRIRGMPSGGLLESQIQGADAVMATPRQHYEPPPSASRTPPPTIPENRPVKKPGGAPMPTDLRSLGKLLSGSGIFNK